MNRFCDYKISADKWRITINGTQYGIPGWINKETLDNEKTLEILFRALSYTYDIPLKKLIKNPDIGIKFDNRIKQEKKNGRRKQT